MLEFRLGNLARNPLPSRSAINKVMKWCRQNQPESISPLRQQAELLVEIGTLLRHQRQEQQLSLEEVAAKTLIQRRLLAAIEAGKLEQLPEPIYIRSFIRQYADALGLDGLELANSFPASDRRSSLKPTWMRLPTVRLRPVHLYLLYILVIVGAVQTLSQMLHRADLQLSQPPPEQPAITARVEPLEQQLKPVSDTRSATAKTDKPVQVNLNLKADSWIRVVADGKKQFEGLLPQGTQRTWAAQQQLTVKVGNAGGVILTFNEEEAKQLGNPGEVQEVTFAANPRS